jgi:hypothetical protein
MKTKAQREGQGLPIVDRGAEEKTETGTDKPQIHTTKYGTQSVRVADIINSQVGWQEIVTLSEANIVVKEPS